MKDALESGRLAAVLGMLAGAIMISTSAPWVAVANVAPSVSAFYRMAFGAIGLFAVCLLSGRRTWQGSRYAIRFLPVAIFFALDLYFWHRSIVYIGPGLSTVLANLQVFFLATAGWVLYREKVGVRFAVGTAATFTGIWLLVGHTWAGVSDEYRIGVVFGILTAIAYAAFILSMRAAQSSVRTLSPPANLAWMSVFCAIILAGVALIEGQSFIIPDRQSWLALLAYGFVCQVLGWVVITRSMPSLPAALVGIFLLLQPALSFLWDVLFFARPFSAVDAVGVAAVLMGIYIASRKKND